MQSPLEVVRSPLSRRVIPRDGQPGSKGSGCVSMARRGQGTPQGAARGRGFALSQVVVCRHPGDAPQGHRHPFRISALPGASARARPTPAPARPWDSPGGGWSWCGMVLVPGGQEIGPGITPRYHVRRFRSVRNRMTGRAGDSRDLPPANRGANDRNPRDAIRGAVRSAGREATAGHRSTVPPLTVRGANVMPWSLRVTGAGTFVHGYKVGTDSARVGACIRRPDTVLERPLRVEGGDRRRPR